MREAQAKGALVDFNDGRYSTLYRAIGRTIGSKELDFMISLYIHSICLIIIHNKSCWRIIYNNLLIEI